MSVSGISGSTGYQAYQPPVQKTGGQNNSQVKPSEAQGAAEENKESAVQKSTEAQQSNQTSGSKSINLYA